MGLNAHLRTDPATMKHLKSKGITPITVPQATELAKRVKAIKYTEYAQHESGASAFFEDAIRTFVFPSTRLQRVRTVDFRPCWYTRLTFVNTGNGQAGTHGRKS